MTTIRTAPPLEGDERAMLNAWLDYHRSTLALKCDGLAEERLRARSVAPSTLSLLGLVRHMADAERLWFRAILAGQDAPPRFWSAEAPDGGFDNVDTADVAEAFEAWREEIDFARGAVAATASLDDTGKHTELEGPRSGMPLSLRWIMLHMIEEYARHNGHADLLRERIDGTVGD